MQKITYSGVTCFRAVFEPPANKVPKLQWLTDEVSGTRTLISKEGPFRMLLMYPCRAGTPLNFVGFYDDPLQDVEGKLPMPSVKEIPDHEPQAGHRKRPAKT